MIFSWLKKVINFKNYNASKYWDKRHREFEGNIQAVGHLGRSKKQNELEYENARDTFNNLCNYLNIEWGSKNILDIGCGCGFYTKLISEKDAAYYTGIDITDYPLEKLRKKYPYYNFKKHNISKMKLDDKFDIILMIDVVQHITSEKEFKVAMENIKRNLTTSGFLIITSDLTDKTIKRSSHVVARPLSEFQKIFGKQNYSLIKTLSFRDKVISAFKKI